MTYLIDGHFLILKVTKKSDLSDFYFNLGKNVAFGANETGPRKPEKHPESKNDEKIDKSDRVQPLNDSNVPESSGVTDRTRDETSYRENNEPQESRPITNDALPETAVQESSSAKQPSDDQPNRDHHKRGEDAVAAARERFMARKKAKQ